MENRRNEVEPNGGRQDGRQTGWEGQADRQAGREGGSGSEVRKMENSARQGMAHTEWMQFAGYRYAEKE